MPSNLRTIHVNGTEVLVETALLPGNQPTSPLSRTREAVINSYSDAQNAILAVAESTIDTVKRIKGSARPDQFELKFGLKFSYEGKVFIAGASGEASLEVKLVYGTAQFIEDE